MTELMHKWKFSIKVCLSLEIQLFIIKTNKVIKKINASSQGGKTSKNMDRLKWFPIL